MSFFFSDEEIAEKARVHVDLDSLGPHCTDCGLYRSCNSPQMKYSGKGKRNCLIIAEAPGPDEDRLGTQLIGSTGQDFRDDLKKHRLDLHNDFWRVNAINCWPQKDGKTRPPAKEEVKYCYPLVQETIRVLNPNYIWLMGGVACQSFYLGRRGKDSISFWRGLRTPDYKHKSWVTSLFHRSFINRTNDPNATAIYNHDLNKAVEMLDWEPFDYFDPKTMVRIVTDYKSVIHILDKVIEKEPEWFYFDYECTGLKPFAPGHRIISVSFATSIEEAFSFPFQLDNHFNSTQQIQIKRRLRKILTNPNIGKRAHNIAFEHVWSKEILGVVVNNWDYDTILSAHILDNRPGVAGLKFQCYKYFGIDDYSSSVDGYLKSKRKSANAFNKIQAAPLKDLLLYGGIDSLLGAKLAIEHEIEMTEHPREREWARKFFQQGAIELAWAQIYGLRADEEYYHTQTEQLQAQIEEKNNYLLNHESAEQFNHEYGRTINLGSNDDIGKLIKLIASEDDLTYTDKRNVKVDKTALERLDLEFTNELLALRKLDKVRNTYLAQFEREICNSELHSIFNLFIPRTYRGSVSNPNFQNIPTRDEFSKNVCRGGLLPRPGHRILEPDFSGIEVAISACYNQDPNLIKYVSDKSTDMHRDSAADIWMINATPAQWKDADTLKKVRFFSKNCWVFPQFYGSYYGNCAKDLWKNSKGLVTHEGIPLREHARNHGIYNLSDLTDHLQGVEEKFWNVRFGVYKQWKEEINALYRKQGYIDTLTGFRLEGSWMSPKEVSNYPIQGSAFHILLWTLIQVAIWLRKNKMDTRIIGQIHDSMVLDAHPDEAKDVLEYIIYIGTVKTREVFKWINVPLEIEVDACKVDEPWSKKKEISLEEL